MLFIPVRTSVNRTSILAEHTTCRYHHREDYKWEISLPGLADFKATTTGAVYQFWLNRWSLKQLHFIVSLAWSIKPFWHIGIKPQRENSWLIFSKRKMRHIWLSLEEWRRWCGLLTVLSRFNVTSTPSCDISSCHLFDVMASFFSKITPDVTSYLNHYQCQHPWMASV